MAPMPESEMLAIKERAETWLFTIPGVTGVGLAPKRVRGEFTKTIAIIVYVEKKRPMDQVPTAERIPASIDGIPTDVIESPAITVRQTPPPVPDAAEYAVLRAGIHVASPEGGGTLGFIGITTTDNVRGAGRHVLVSNQHVLMGDTRDIAPGSAHSIGQPDGHSCCESCDFCGRIVGHLRAPCVLNEDVDSGLAELIPGVQWRPEVQDSPNPVPIVDIRTVTTADVPLNVWKRGATTLRTTGKITDPNASFNTKLHNGQPHRMARRSIRIEGPGFCDDGDSGAPLLDTSNRLVGILFGGQGSVSSACHIQKVLSNLRIIASTTANTPVGVQTVPPRAPVLNDRNTRAPALPQIGEIGEEVVVVLTSPQSFYDAVARTGLGRDFVRRLVVHREEIRRLARMTRVLAAWRRFGAAHVTARIGAGLTDGQIVVPATYGERSAEVCAHRFAAVLKRYCSDELARDLDRYLPYVPPLAGKTAREFLAALRDASTALSAVPVR